MFGLSPRVVVDDAALDEKIMQGLVSAAEWNWRWWCVGCSDGGSVVVHRMAIWLAVRGAGSNGPDPLTEGVLLNLPSAFASPWLAG